MRSVVISRGRGGMVMDSPKKALSVAASCFMSGVFRASILAFSLSDRHMGVQSGSATIGLRFSFAMILRISSSAARPRNLPISSASSWRRFLGGSKGFSSEWKGGGIGDGPKHVLNNTEGIPKFQRPKDQKSNLRREASEGTETDVLARPAAPVDVRGSATVGAAGNQPPAGPRGLFLPFIRIRGPPFRMVDIRKHVPDDGFRERGLAWLKIKGFGKRVHDLRLSKVFGRQAKTRSRIKLRCSIRHGLRKQPPTVQVCEHRRERIVVVHLGTFGVVGLLPAIHEHPGAWEQGGVFREVTLRDLIVEPAIRLLLPPGEVGVLCHVDRREIVELEAETLPVLDAFRGDLTWEGRDGDGLTEEGGELGRFLLHEFRCRGLHPGLLLVCETDGRPVRFCDVRPALLLCHDLAHFLFRFSTKKLADKLGVVLEALLGRLKRVLEGVEGRGHANSAVIASRKYTYFFAG